MRPATPSPSALAAWWTVSVSTVTGGLGSVRGHQAFGTEEVGVCPEEEKSRFTEVFRICAIPTTPSPRLRI